MARSRTLLILGIAACAAVAVLTLVVILDARRPVEIVIQPDDGADIRVSISGAVATPGAYILPADARLSDVVAAAGGTSVDADLSLLNMAGRVGDGESVTVPRVSAMAATPKPGVININTATAEQLETLPGIGPTLAARIIEFRTVNGPFTSVDELDAIDGISLTMVDELRPYVTVGSDG